MGQAFPHGPKRRRVEIDEDTMRRVLRDHVLPHARCPRTTWPSGPGWPRAIVTACDPWYVWFRDQRFGRTLHVADDETPPSAQGPEALWDTLCARRCAVTNGSIPLAAVRHVVLHPGCTAAFVQSLVARDHVVSVDARPCYTEEACATGLATGLPRRHTPLSDLHVYGFGTAAVDGLTDVLDRNTQCRPTRTLTLLYSGLYQDLLHDNAPPPVPFLAGRTPHTLDLGDIGGHEPHLWRAVTAGVRPVLRATVTDTLQHALPRSAASDVGELDLWLAWTPAQVAAHMARLVAHAQPKHLRLRPAPTAPGAMQQLIAALALIWGDDRALALTLDLGSCDDGGLVDVLRHTLALGPGVRVTVVAHPGWARDTIRNQFTPAEQTAMSSWWPAEPQPPPLDFYIGVGDEAGSHNTVRARWENESEVIRGGLGTPWHGRIADQWLLGHDEPVTAEALDVLNHWVLPRRRRLAAHGREDALPWPSPASIPLLLAVVRAADFLQMDRLLAVLGPRFAQSVEDPASRAAILRALGLSPPADPVHVQEIGRDDTWFAAKGILVA